VEEDIDMRDQDGKHKGRMVSPKKITGRFTKRSRKMNMLK